MAIYYFHLLDGVEILLDPDGRELDPDSIARAALNEARAMIAADAHSGHIRLDQQIEVQDAAGETIHRVNFEDAVKVTHLAVCRR